MQSSMDKKDIKYMNNYYKYYAFMHTITRSQLTYYLYKIFLIHKQYKVCTSYM